ncbi:XRE family transcriptional regulator [Streptomyces sp. NPDC005336]|uniref:helix-turn-helix domain-containing protein n=1 Tax=Streptomyces sp. NPDC005336 TaxID=3157035 RepID=UPI0033B8F75E
MPTVLAASPGERLRTLRELLGLTQAQLSKMSGVGASWISEVENGYKDHDDTKLQMIADATETPFGFFYVQPKSVPLDSLRFRKLASAKRTVTKRVHAFYNESYRVSEEMLTSERYPTPPLPYATMDEVTDEDIEELAIETRQALRLAPDLPIPHLTRALERGGIAVAPIVLNDPAGGEDQVTGNHFGVSYWGGLGDVALIGYFPGENGDRDRFTLAHEIGHLVLHTFRPRAADPEGEANRFASALLVPRERALEAISERMTLTEYARLKATWGVSIQSLIMRGAAVGVIDETRKRSLYVQLSQRGWRKKEPVHVGQEEPLLLWTLLSRKFGVKPYVPAAEELSIPPTVLRSIAPTPEKVRGNSPVPSGSHVGAGQQNVVDLRSRKLRSAQEKPRMVQ